MWNYDEDEQAAVEVSTDRAVIGTIYLMLVGVLLSGLVQLWAG